MRDRKFVYLVACLAAGMLACMLASVCISVRASEQAIRKAEQGQCDGLQADVDAYREEPPITKSGKRQLQSKVDRLRALHCPEGK